MFLTNGVVFDPAKAANAGGVATSALEMCQNSMRNSWTFQVVDEKLKEIMINIYRNISSNARDYSMENNFVAGANIAGFIKIATTMYTQGVIWI